MSTSQSVRRAFFIGDSIVVWYNPVRSTENDPTIEPIRRLFSVIHFFDDRKEMINFIKTIETERIFLIFSGDIDRNLLESVHDFKQIISIYVLGETAVFNEGQNLKKLRGFFKSIEDLYQSARENKRCTENNQAKMTISTLNLNEIDPSFIYAQLLKDVLLELRYDENSKITFAEFAKSQYSDNRTIQTVIEEFKNDHHHSAIRWYTRETFLYLMLNGAFRNQDIDTLHKLGFFIRDLHHQLRQLQTQAPFLSTITVYRGQGLSRDDFQRIQSSPNGIISFHYFLSTSRVERVALQRAESNAENDELVGILFEMTIDPSIGDATFASIDNESDFGSSEAEVLFSTNTIFRIGRSERLGSNLYRIQLTLVRNEDQDIKQLTQYLREEISIHDNPLLRFGQLTLRMQEWTKAKEIYQERLNAYISMQHTEGMAHSYHQLGYIYYRLNDPNAALENLNKSLEVLRKYRKLNVPAVADTYSMIGQVLYEQGRLNEALEKMLEALKRREKEFKPERQTLAKNYTQIGETLLYLQRYNEAADYLKKALEIQSISLPKVHMDLAETQVTIGLVHYHLADFEQALFHSTQALDIYQRCLPSNHSSLASSHTNMAMCLGKLKRFDQAIVHIKETIRIFRSRDPPDHSKISEAETILEKLEAAQKRYENPTVNNAS